MARFRVFDVLERALTLAFTNFGTFVRALWPFIGVAAAIGIVEVALFGSMEEIGGEAFLAELEQGRIPDQLALATSGGAFFGIVGRLVTLVATGVGIVVAAGLLDGEKRSLAEAWDRLRPRLANLFLTGILVALALGAVVVAGVLAAIAVVLGTGFTAGSFDPVVLLELVPFAIAIVAVVVWLLLRWAVVEPVSVLETNGVGSNLRRSSDLTDGSKWAILGAYLVLFIAVGLGSGLLTAPATMLAMAAGPSTTSMVVQVLFNAAVELLVAPIFAAFTVVLYRALRPPTGPVVVPTPPPPPLT